MAGYRVECQNLVICLTYSFLRNKAGLDRSWRPAVFCASAFIFVLFFLFLYIMQSVRKIPMNLGPSSRISNRCKQVTDYATETQCSCGGHRELLAHWTWVPHVSDYK